MVDYVHSNGRDPVKIWLRDAGGQVVERITRAIFKLEAGLRSDVKSVGEGVFECRIDYGNGYRLYFANDGDLIVLLGAGSKDRQGGDIQEAKKRWQDYKTRKRRGE